MAVVRSAVIEEWQSDWELGFQRTNFEGDKHPVHNSPLTPVSPLGRWQQNMLEMVTGSSSTDKVSWGTQRECLRVNFIRFQWWVTRSIPSGLLLLKLSCAHESPRWVLEWRFSFRRSGKGLRWFMSNNVGVQTPGFEKQGRRGLWGPWQRTLSASPCHPQTWHDAWRKNKFSINICWIDQMGDTGYKDTFCSYVSC